MHKKRRIERLFEQIILLCSEGMRGIHIVVYADTSNLPSKMGVKWVINFSSGKDRNTFLERYEKRKYFNICGVNMCGCVFNDDVCIARYCWDCESVGEVAECESIMIKCFCEITGNSIRGSLQNDLEILQSMVCESDILGKYFIS